jgi:uncharacterized membrane protein (UPF0127 family)
MFKTKMLTFAVVSMAAIAAVLVTSGCTSILSEQVCLKGTCFSVDIVDTPQERERGLMGVESLGDDEGMLFVFEGEGNYQFWMKDTLIPLDMIWIDKGGRIVYIEKDAQPCTADPCTVYGPPAVSAPALYVLEVNGGTADRLGLAVGDEVVLRI